MMTFEQRVERFNLEIARLQKESGVSIYAANVVLKNGEVMPMIRVADMAKEQDIIINNEKTHDQSNSKRRHPGNKKA